MVSLPPWPSKPGERRLDRHFLWLLLLYHSSSPRVKANLMDETFDPDAPMIEDQIAALAAEVPPEDWGRLPVDVTDHLDEYLYGECWPGADANL